MGEWVGLQADFTREWDAPQEIAPARFAARQGFVVARKRKTCRHRLFGIQRFISIAQLLDFFFSTDHSAPFTTPRAKLHQNLWLFGVFMRSSRIPKYFFRHMQSR